MIESQSFDRKLTHSYSNDRGHYIHLAMWILLISFPVSIRGTGNVNAAQVLLHGVMLIFIVSMIVIVRFDRPIMLPRKETNEYLIFVLTFLAYFASLTATNLFAGRPNDLMDVLRPLVYFMYFLFPFLFPLSAGQFVSLLRTIVVLAILTIFLSILVYAPVAWPFVDIWKGRTSSDPVIFHFYRWSGTSGYPSDYSFFLSFFFYIFIFSRKSIVGPKADVFLVALFGIAAAMTMSRGGIATIAVLTFVGCLFFRKYRVLLNLSLFSIGFTASLVWVASLVDVSIVNLDYVWSLLDIGFAADASAQYRVNELGLAVSYSVEHFPFGEGAARDVISKDIPIVESLYGHYLIKWGVIGIAGYYLVTAYIMRESLALDRGENHFLVQAFGRAVFLLVLSVPLVFGLSSAIADRFKGLPFFFLLAGYAVSLSMRRKKLSGGSPEPRLLIS